MNKNGTPVTSDTDRGQGFSELEQTIEICEFCGASECSDEFEYACDGKRYAMAERAQDGGR